MVVPFIGHIISGTLMILNIYFEQWDARLLWLSNVYILFGGYTLLNIAMYGYIGDVTTTKQRTMILSILGALGMVMMPVADFVGGQVYKVGGFAPVYFTSLGFVFVGLFYIWIIPESVTRRKNEKIEDEKSLLEKEEKPRRSLWRFFVDTNKLFLETTKYIFRKRKFGERHIIFSMLALSFLSSMRAGGAGTSGVLYTQKKFGWTVTQYTNYEMFWSVHIAIKGFIVMPFLCYVLLVHDCVISIMGSISGIEENLVFAFATHGWHMYFAVGLSAFSGSKGTPSTSILSKCVPASQLGKIFAVSQAIATIFGMLMSYLSTLLYNLTINGFLGASYCLNAAFEGLNLIGMCFVYYFIWKNEKKFGPLGERDE